jgi:protein-serine/threonine kinase
LTAKPPAERKQDVRMSTMSENEVMAKLKEAVSKDDPNMSYSKQKKIGQGASGSVYVAKVKENPLSPIAREVIRQQGSKAQVAIKQMDLAHQPRKELIVNEIMVMKDSKHRNIVNFLDAFLRNNSSELWVVMEYMEGGALTDVIDNNPTITEDQISTICLEVRKGRDLKKNRTDCSRLAVALSTCIINPSSTVISRVTTFSLTLVETSKLVSLIHTPLRVSS